ncbi:MAG: TonB-dependent receptor [Acidobacteria bacterium]|nr:TonB-dependent receptor [Acidobacteriota bacterium]
MKLRAISGVSIFATLIFSLPLYAQFRSSIEGTITDSSGAMVAGAEVTLTNTATGVSETSQSNNEGLFRFPSLPPGNYKLTCTKQGFQTLVQENVSLAAEQVRTVAMAMKVGQISETVTVSTETAPIQLSEAKIGGDISTREINELPLSGRNIFNLVSQAPGVTGIGQASGGAFDNSVFSLVNGGQTNANGQRGDANAFYLDNTLATSNPDPGVYNLTPNPESIQEFHVSVNDYSAEYGHSGGLMIQAVTKSGTNQFHGSLFEYHTDNALMARGLNQTTPDLTGRIIPVSRRNEFGGSIGGPIQKDKTFIFFSWDQLISAQATVLQGNVETPQFVSFMTSNFPNNLSTKLMTQYPAKVQSVLPGSIQTVQQRDPNCAAKAPIVGIPCNLPVLETVTDSFAPKNNGKQWNVRVDRYFRDSKDRVNGNFFRKTPDTISPNIRPAFENPNSFAGITNYANLDWTHTFSPTMLNDAAFGITRISGLGTCVHCEVPPIGITSLANAGFGNGFSPAEFIQNDYHWRDVLSLTHGRHGLKTGIDIFRDQENDLFTGPQQRVFYNFFQNSPAGGVDSLFDFANDRVPEEDGINFDLRNGGPAYQNIGLRSTTFGFFAQDDVKIKPNLSVNAGLRWDFSSNPYEVNHRLSQIILGPGSTLQQQVAGASVGVVPNLFHQHRFGYFAPRLGLAWDPTKTGKISVRAGMGVFFNRWPNKVWSDPTRNNPPFEGGPISAILGAPGPQPVYGLCQFAVFPFNCPVPSGLPIGLNARGGALPAAGISSIGGTLPDLRYAYNIARFIGVQYALTPTWIFEADYAGSHDVHLYVNTDRNRCFGCFDPTTGTRISSNGSFQPNPFFLGINLTDNSGWSYHNGGTFSLQHRFSQSFTFQAAYTVGHTVSNVDAPTPGHDSSFAPVYYPYNPSAQKGPASFDIEQGLTVHGLWELPRLSAMNPIVRGILGGWQWTGAANFQGGYPYTVQDCNHSPDGGVSCLLPDVSASARDKHCSKSQFLAGCLAPAAFSLPSQCALNSSNQLTCQGSWEGNVGRNTFRGPGFANVDFSTMKYFNLPWFGGREGARLQIRGEFFNLFNRTNLMPITPNNGSTDINAGNFTKSATAYNPRTIQVGVRVEF